MPRALAGYCHGHVGLRRVDAIDERHVIDHHIVGARGGGREQQDEGRRREQGAQFHGFSAR